MHRLFSFPKIPLFHEKITALMPIFIQKYVYSLKKHTALMPILVKKTYILSKTQCSHVLFFFNFFMKNSCCRAHDWSKNVNFVKTTLFWAKKGIGCPFFLFLTKKLLLLCQYFVKKTSIL